MEFELSKTANKYFLIITWLLHLRCSQLLHYYFSMFSYLYNNTQFKTSGFIIEKRKLPTTNPIIFLFKNIHL